VLAVEKKGHMGGGSREIDYERRSIENSTTTISQVKASPVSWLENPNRGTEENLIEKLIFSTSEYSILGRPVGWKRDEEGLVVKVRRTP